MPIRPLFFNLFYPETKTPKIPLNHPKTPYIGYNSKQLKNPNLSGVFLDIYPFDASSTNEVSSFCEISYLITIQSWFAFDHSGQAISSLRASNMTISCTSNLSFVEHFQFFLKNNLSYPPIEFVVKGHLRTRSLKKIQNCVGWSSHIKGSSASCDFLKPYSESGKKLNQMSTNSQFQKFFLRMVYTLVGVLEKKTLIEVINVYSA